MAGPAAVNSDNGNGTGKLSELAEPRWSVFSFDKVEAKGLTYAEAAVKMAELESAGIPGLCIVANEAAERLK